MAGNTLTDVQIFNRALMRMGESVDNFVTAVDGSDTSKYGVVAGYEYFPTRNEEIRAHKWLFAVKRVALTQAFLNAIASWTSTQASMTLAGVTIVTFTANSAIVAGSDLQSRTLLSVSIPPSASWVGQNISGTGIAPDTVVRGINYLNNSIILSRPVTATNTGTTFYLVPLRVGWMVTSALAPGTTTPTYPAGIATGTVVTAISVAGSTVTLTLNLPTTANGSSVSICIQAQNNVGYWYMYNKPADALRDDYVYVLLPEFIYLWPFSVVHQDFFPSRVEGQYIYTDLDPNNGNPYCAYLAEVTDTTLFDQLFVEALVVKLVCKICFYGTGGDKLYAEFDAVYHQKMDEAKTMNLLEMESDIDGNVWWTDRERS